MASLRCADLLCYKLATVVKLYLTKKNQEDTSGLVMHFHLCMSMCTSMCNCACVLPVVLQWDICQAKPQLLHSTFTEVWAYTKSFEPFISQPLFSLYALADCLSLSLSWQFVTLPPRGRHQFRWASYVTGQLCLFKPLSVPLHPPCHHSPSYTFCALFCVCVRTPPCCNLGIHLHNKHHLF